MSNDARISAATLVAILLVLFIRAAWPVVIGRIRTTARLRRERMASVGLDEELRLIVALTREADRHVPPGTS